MNEELGGINYGANPRYDVRMDGVYFVRSQPQSPFNLSLEHGDFAYCFMVRRGRMVLDIEFPVPASLTLNEGDIVALSGLAPHAFKTESAPASTQGHFLTLPLDASFDDGAATDLIIGCVPQETLALSNLILGPIYLNEETTPASWRRIWKAADLLLEEFRGSGPVVNQPIIVRRIAEIILLNMTRTRIEESQDDLTPVPHQPNIGIFKGLRAFLNDPFNDWTVDELAHKSGMSRTKFAEEFRASTGKTPIQTLTRIRLTMIASQFLVERMSVEEAADLCGYNSAAAFVRAFQREFGETPAKWRKNKLAGEART